MLFTSSHCSPLNVFFHQLSRHFEMHQKRNLEEIGGNILLHFGARQWYLEQRRKRTRDTQHA